MATVNVGPWVDPSGGAVPGGYHVGDVTHHNGIFWKCATNGTTAVPGTNADWTQMSLVPWTAVRLLSTPDLVVQGTWVPTISALVFLNGYVNNSSLAINDGAAWAVDLSAGTWNFDIFDVHASACGIATVDFSQDGGTTWTAIGTKDCYVGTGTTGARDTFTGVVIPKTTRTLIRFRMLSKNASSSNYSFGLSAMQWTRTA